MPAIALASKLIFLVLCLADGPGADRGTTLTASNAITIEKVGGGQ
jgi:hypothetical protein